MHLAEINVARLVAPKDDPRVAEFMDNLVRINGLGRRMPGFVWLMGDTANPDRGNTDMSIGGDPLLMPNVSVWESAQDLHRYVFDTLHKRFFERRSAWFEVLGELHFAMWHVPEGHLPDLDEALQRLDYRRKNGDSDQAFGWDWLNRDERS